ncbi:unnamed protein product, partial [Mesorhabditis spiculigera]
MRVRAGTTYFGQQRYNDIKKQCEKSGQYFVDTDFPPTNTSLFLEGDRSSDIVWKRPGEICSNPQLFVEGASPNDVTQGILGNCWFVSACSALTHNQDLLEKVIPAAHKQEWATGNTYSGIFRFRFWRFGTWMEVVVDDLLPTRDGRLLFARSKTPNEFWSALLEKAFAKLYGCYENLVGGHLSDALQDVSGGVAETISVVKFLRNDPAAQSDQLFERLRMAYENEALVIAAIAARTKEEIEETLACGLVKGHAYAVTDVRFIELDAKGRSLTTFLLGKTESQRMIRLQNPWGEKEWNGPWSDGSPEWEQVTELTKKSLGITVDEDGEFWMPWESFAQYFTDISVCQLFNTSVFSLEKNYDEKIFFGQWTSNGARSGAPGDMAGGCLNFPASFCSNPQYLFDVVGEKNEVMFALTQREVGEGKKRREPFVCIGMHVMRVERNRITRVHQPTEPIETSDYANARSVFLHIIDLRPGRYILLPTTYAPREQANYMLRAYSSEKLNIRALTKHAPTQGWCWQSTGYVTRVHIMDAEIPTASGDFYCVINDQKEKVRTRTIRDTTKPQWDEQFVFFKRSAQQKYMLEIWEDRRMSKDRLVARMEVMALTDNDCREEVKEFAEGRVRLKIAAYDDPLYL